MGIKLAGLATRAAGPSNAPRLLTALGALATQLGTQRIVARADELADEVGRMREIRDNLVQQLDAAGEELFRYREQYGPLPELERGSDDPDTHSDEGADG